MLWPIHDLLKLPCLLITDMPIRWLLSSNTTWMTRIRIVYFKWQYTASLKHVFPAPIRDEQCHVQTFNNVAVCAVTIMNKAFFWHQTNEKSVAIICLPCWRKYALAVVTITGNHYKTSPIIKSSYLAIGISLCPEKQRNLVRNPTNVHKPPFLTSCLFTRTFKSWNMTFL